MAQSTHTLYALKRAANYSKLALHKDGPKSFKKGQGALTKVLEKFGEAGALSADELAGRLRWDGAETADVVKKAQENGYVLEVKGEDGIARVTLTDKGREVVAKRFAAEDRAADEICQRLTDEEKSQLEALCGKIIEQCEAMGVDYSLIRKKRECCAKGAKGDKKAAKKADKKAKDAKKSKKDEKKSAKAAKKSSKKSGKKG